MATTTNYGWTTPDDTALVKDGASAIRTLGSSVDTTTKALNPETTLGDIAYRSSTANVKTRLGLGTAGQVLQVNSGATAPEWATLSTPTSKVVQIVNATYTTGVTISAGSTADTGLSATITPTSASNKVLVFFSQMAGTSGGGYCNAVYLKRGATTIGSNYGSEFLYLNTNSYSTGVMSGNYLDSPATTSATTYKTNSQTSGAAGSVTWQWNGSQGTITLMEVTP